MKVIIECNEKQADIIQESLELSSRVLAGHIQELDNFLFKNGYYAGETRPLIDELKKAYFPDLHVNANYGIYHDKTHEDAKIGYDIIQVLRNKFAFHRYPDGGMGVSFSEPLPSSKVELIKVKIEE